LLVLLGEEGRARLAAAGQGIAGALARLLAIVYTATADGTWPRFKVCGNDTCRWAFYDHSKNQSGLFCGTACGNAVHARAYRRRRAAGRVSAE
jgi:predicted RNA-binding Zn ribbon-like protein